MKLTNYEIIGFMEGHPEDPIVILSGKKYNYTYFCDVFLTQESDIVYYCVMLVRYSTNNKGEKIYQILEKLYS